MSPSNLVLNFSAHCVYHMVQQGPGTIGDSVYSLETYHQSGRIDNGCLARVVLHGLASA